MPEETPGSQRSQFIIIMGHIIITVYSLLLLERACPAVRQLATRGSRRQKLCLKMQVPGCRSLNPRKTSTQASVPRLHPKEKTHEPTAGQERELESEDGRLPCTLGL